MFLHDLSALLVSNQLVKRSLLTLRPECEFSPELVTPLDTVVDLTDKCETDLRETLEASGAVLPTLAKGTGSAVVTMFMSNLPVRVAPAIFAAEVISNLRLLVQHIELKAALAAEAAILVGQTQLSRSLWNWSAEWRACGRLLRRVTVRVRAHAYVADLDDMNSAMQPA
jgi:hypothetical protein